MNPNLPLRQANQQASPEASRPGRPPDPQAPLSGKTAQWVALFEQDCQVRYRPATARSYLHKLRCFLSWLCPRRVDLFDVRPADLHAYQSELLVMRHQGKPLAAWTLHGRIGAVKAFFRFLYRRGAIFSDPSSGIEYPRVDLTLPRHILTVKEASRLMEAARQTSPVGLRDRAILETLYGTGLRVGELVALGCHDVDTEEAVLRVRGGKGGKDRHLPLTRAACRAIEAYLLAGRPILSAGKRPPKSPPLFLAQRTGGSLQIPVVNRLIQRYARRAGLKKMPSAHTLRHSVATHLLKGRADIRHIQALLGHERLSTTERYTRVEISDLAQVMRRAHPRGR